MGSLYRSKHELVFVYKVGTAPHFNAVELGKHGRNRTNVWEYASVNSFAGSRREDLEHLSNIRNHRGFPRVGVCDSRCGLVKEASLHDTTSFD